MVQEAKTRTTYHSDDRNRSFALSYAKDVVCAMVQGSGPGGHGYYTRRTLYDIADDMLAYLNGETNGESATRT